MDLKVGGKTALVLAAGKGLGKAIALKYCEEGANVMICARTESDLEKVKAESEGFSGDLSYQIADITKSDELKNVIDKTLELYGSIDLLVNNEGGPPSGAFFDPTEEQWLSSFESSILTIVRTTREIVPVMMRNGGGRIVNIASSSTKQPFDNLVLSNTLRPAIVGMAKTLALEVAESQILVNTLSPGRIRTDRVVMFEELAAKRNKTTADEERAKAESKIPLKRAADPEEFACAAVFFGSFANTFITGETILVDGGAVRAL